MADLSQTATSVLAISVSSPKVGVLGATLTAGTPVILSSGTLLAARSNTYLNAQSVGILLTGGNSGQTAIYAGTPGDIVNVGATVVAGERYDVSTNSGKIAPTGDTGAAAFGFLLGYTTPTFTDRITLTLLSLGATAHG